MKKDIKPVSKLKNKDSVEKLLPSFRANRWASLLFECVARKIKLATAIIIEIKLYDKRLFLFLSSENFIISKTPRQFRKKSSDKTY